MRKEQTLSATPEDCEYTIRGLIALLEQGAGVPEGTLNYLHFTEQ